MKCFNHPQIDAIGFCRACGRALCRECVGEVSGILCCKGRCESNTKTGIESEALLREARAQFQALKKVGVSTMMRTTWLMAVAAILFLGAGIFGKIQKDTGGSSNLMLLIGIVAGLRVVFMIVASRQIRKVAPNTASK